MAEVTLSASTLRVPWSMTQTDAKLDVESLFSRSGGNVWKLLPTRKRSRHFRFQALSHRGFPLWLMVYLTVPYVCTSMEKWLGPLLKVFGITDGVIIVVM